MICQKKDNARVKFLLQETARAGPAGAAAAAGPAFDGEIDRGSRTGLPGDHKLLYFRKGVEGQAMSTQPAAAFDALATEEQVTSAAEALRQRGIKVEVLDSAAAALARIRTIIPAGASVCTGASITLREIGFDDLLKTGDHGWKNLKAEFLAEKDPARQMQLRRQSVLADFYLGSVHAVAETGEVVVASMTGSQLAPYAYSARNLVWVVGAQKITPTVDQAVRRVREFVLPHENERMLAQSGGKMGSRIGKIMIFEFEVAFLNRSVTLLFVRQKLGD